ncbi:MAG: LysE family transporter [Firmicutes bacterium]|nr:LysE family transporter [Bacillota bacterium]
MPSITVFLSYVLLTTFTPGPNNIMSMSNASRYGFRKTLNFNLGIFFGFLSIIALCSIFSVTLFRLIPSIKPIMTWIGAIYILFLAWKTFTSKPDLHDPSKKNTNTFLIGFLLQFVNPKAILYGITIFSTFIVPYYKSFYMISFFVVFLALIGFTSTCSWSLFGSLFQKLLYKYSKIINSVMALLLVYCAVSLFL